MTKSIKELSMCGGSTPKAPAPQAAAPKLPSNIDRGTTKKKQQNPYVVTGSRGIYQPLQGKEFLGQ